MSFLLSGVGFEPTATEGAWQALVAAGLAGCGTATGAFKQADAIHKVFLEKLETETEALDAGSWLRYAIGALQYSGNATQALLQADAALKETRLRYPRPRWAGERHAELEREFQEKIRQHPIPEGTKVSVRLQLPVSVDQIELKPVLDIQPVQASQVTSVEIPAEALAAPAEPPPVEVRSIELPQEPLVEVEPARVVPREPLIVDVPTPAQLVHDQVQAEKQAVPETTPVGRLPWMVFLGSMLPAGDAADKAIEEVVATWPAAADFVADPQALTAMSRLVATAGSGRKWDPARKAKNLFTFAAAWVNLTATRTADDPWPTVEQVAGLPLVDRSVLDGYRMLVLGEQLAERPEHPRLAAAWDVAKG